MPQRTSYVTLFLRFLGVARGEPLERSPDPESRSSGVRRIGASEAYLRFLEVARSDTSGSTAVAASTRSTAERETAAMEATEDTILTFDVDEAPQRRIGSSTTQAEAPRQRYRSAGETE